MPGPPVRRLGHGQPRDHRHARGRRPRHVHRDRPDRGERDRPARQHRDRHGAGRRRRWGYHQQHGDQFGDADALRRSPDHQGAARQRRGRDQCRLHDHRHECGAVGCHRRHAHRPDAPRPDVRRERRGLHDGLPVQPRHAAPRRDPHDHGDLRGPVRLHDAESDRQHGDGVESDAGPARATTSATTDHAGRRAGDRSPHHEDQRRRRRGRGPADDLHHHRHQPARAERREWRHGHRHVPDDADRRDVDLCRHRAAAPAPPPGAATSTRP